MSDNAEDQPAPEAPSALLEALAPKEQLFVLYLSADPKRVGFRAVQRAGWKQKDDAAAVTACRLLKKAKVKAALDEELKKQVKELRKDGAYIVRRMLEAECFDVTSLYNLDTGQLKPMSEWPAGAGTIVEGLKLSLEPQLDLFKRGKDGKAELVQNIEVKIPSRKSMWELLGRHFGIFKDSLDLNLKGDLAQRIRQARQRATR